MDDSPDGSQSAALIATLGTQPQVITVALDLLLAQGEPIQEVVVIHTARPRPTKGAPQAIPADLMAHTLATLEREFPGRSFYAAQQRPCRYRPICLHADGRQIDDIHTPYQARAVFSAIFNEVQELKRQRLRIHLSIAGGRKSMSIYGMAAAQILFDSQDCLWHLVSTAAFEALSLMHPRSPDDAQLVRIPVLPISTVFPGMVTLLTSRDPLSVLERKQDFVAMEEQRQRQEFLDSLSSSEKLLVDALMVAIVRQNRSLSNSELARRLLLRPSIVRDRLSDVYAKLHAHLRLPDEEQVDRTILVYYLTPHYRDRA
jgi:CRISPR-associated protein Csx14